ncbi:medium chain dehydrogenase/reductase family protein [Planotetraspora phitsanulokensis]|uniref:NADPH:quinone reductase n=1 Tax=Planotetraspora phitsanulokensis TaxID=575192 RepID=A0A8J3XCJ3_9ACTN|nr:medium chain dehydrogenase/reductase family protein [Planotetraspora phitsanulokensis]GII36202.1 NADPH:quinone reductase [Planotetraspora phitsanulokensis]
MRATEVVLPAIGEPESMQLRTRELPDLQAGQALIQVEASGVSFAEQQMRRGKYYDQPAFPFVPGYDLVGIVEALGDGPAAPGAGISVGSRVAALTKIGGWADRVVLDTADLVAVPDGVDAAAAETVVVNGVTAWRMLHRSAHVRAGDTIVVLGASGGVGSTLVQLAAHAGIRVIGTASPRSHDRVRALGAIPVDYNDDVPARVREIAPDGVAAVFDHVGGPGIVASWRMLARGGTLLSYGSASTRDLPGSGLLTVLKLVARLMIWNALPNGRHASFFNLWAGKARHLGRYRADLRADLTQVFTLLASGDITAQVARAFPLADAAKALRYAEAGGFTGKVVILPGTETANQAEPPSQTETHARIEETS